MEKKLSEAALPAGLQPGAKAEILAENLNIAQALYFAAMFESLQGFKVMDVLLSAFIQGTLPIGRGNAGRALYSYWKKKASRLTEAERRNLYSQLFGMPTGNSSSGEPNRAFPDLWARFLRAVVEFAHQAPAGVTRKILTQTSLKELAVDLAANLSEHGYGLAYFAAAEIMTQIREIMAALSEPEIGRAYGARDIWTLIEKVSRGQLKVSVNSQRYRTMANAGSTIIHWLADRSGSFSPSHTLPPCVWEPGCTLPQLGDMPPIKIPSDADLMEACAFWLAADGVPDENLNDYVQPEIQDNNA